MRFHHAQHNQDALSKLSEALKDSMERRGILPKNPWKAKITTAWLSTIGARMKPGSRRFDPYLGCVDCSKFVNFKVECPPSKVRFKCGANPFMRIEIPWELADRILVLGYLP